MEPIKKPLDWKDDPTNPENMICKCGHSKDRHVEGWNVKHCKGDDPKPLDNNLNTTPCLCSSYTHDRNL